MFPNSIDEIAAATGTSEGSRAEEVDGFVAEFKMQTLDFLRSLRDFVQRQLDHQALILGRQWRELNDFHAREERTSKTLLKRRPRIRIVVAHVASHDDEHFSKAN